MTVEPSFTEAETAAMQRALEAALEGPRGANPLVGAALLWLPPVRSRLRR